jgi:hypothetical protein
VPSPNKNSGPTDWDEQGLLLTDRSACLLAGLLLTDRGTTGQWVGLLLTDRSIRLWASATPKLVGR